MKDALGALSLSLRAAIESLAPGFEGEVPIQEGPADKPGDDGTPVAFTLARTLRRPPPQIAAAIVARPELRAGVASAEAVGADINVVLDPGAFVAAVALSPSAPRAPERRKVVVEHTSVNPNKEAHVGHLRNIVLGDATARILKAVGHDVEVQNYIDDTGRPAAQSIFAVTCFNARCDATGHGPQRKYDHWLGELYVRLGQAKESDGEAIERGVNEVMHRLERGELRHEVERVVRAQLETFNSLGAEYDLLVWESDVVQAGFLHRGLEVLENSRYTHRPTEGKYAGALVMDVSSFLPGLE